MQDSVGIPFQGVEELGIEDDAVLDHLGQAAPVLAIGKRGQGGGVDPDAQGLMEGADQVLGPGMIDAHLAADRAVHHRQKRGRHHEQRQPAIERRRHETGQVAHHSAADRDDHSPAIGVEIGQLIVQVRRHGQGLLPLAGWQNRQAGAKTGGAQAFLDRLGVGPNVVIADQERQRAPNPLPGEGAEPLTVVRGHLDVVAAPQAAREHSSWLFPRQISDILPKRVHHSTGSFSRPVRPGRASVLRPFFATGTV